MHNLHNLYTILHYIFHYHPHLLLLAGFVLARFSVCPILFLISGARHYFYFSAVVSCFFFKHSFKILWTICDYFQWSFSGLSFLCDFAHYCEIWFWNSFMVEWSKPFHSSIYFKFQLLSIQLIYKWLLIYPISQTQFKLSMRKLAMRKFLLIGSRRHTFLISDG